MQPFKPLKLIGLGLLMAVLLLATGSELVQAQWPPFTFRLTPTYDDNRITYDLFFVKRHEGRMYDVTINIPIPQGTRFVDSNAQPSTTVAFDGQELSFFTSMLSRNAIRVASFTVEVTDPEQTVFTTQPWLSWKGDLPGDYLPGEVSIDISESTLEWERPARARLQIEATAFAADEVITYAIYPTNVGGRMWDAALHLPLPEGTRFLMAEAPAPFAAAFDGREVKFTASELARQEAYGPLKVHLLAPEADDAVAVTHVWGTWKNEGRAVGRRLPFQEDSRTGDLIIQPRRQQWAVADSLAEVPFSGYDLTSMAVTGGAEALDILLYSWGETGTVEGPLLFIANLNTDCTGGVEYQASFNQGNGQSTFRARNEETGNWNKAEPVEAANLGPRLISFRIPHDLFLSAADTQAFCIIATVQNRDSSYSSRPPTERIPDTNDERVTRYQSVAALAAQRPAELAGRIEAVKENPVPAALPSAVSPVSVPGEVFTSEPAAPDGILAVPVDNGAGAYDVRLYSVPDGTETDRIPFARQPDFRFDGQRLLVNKQGDGLEDVYEYDLTAQSLRAASGAPQDSWPVYDPWGNRVAYGNAELARGVRTPLRNDSGKILKYDDGEIKYVDDGRKPFLFVQCGLLPPAEEESDACQDVAGRGLLIPAGQMGEIVATHPVWAANDEILFNGCNSWAGSEICGIYSVPAASVRRASDGFIPRPLTRAPTDLPADTFANLVAFTSSRDGTWEAYLMNLDGSQQRNISNSPGTNDGLPTISPNGQWVAFVSDRDGGWAVWITPVDGGEVTKLFDLPAAPWGDQARPWLDERLSWGGLERNAPALLAPIPTPDYALRYTPTPQPTSTPQPAPTNTPAAVTSPATPTWTPEPTVTNTPASPTWTPEPTVTNTPALPTWTPEPTVTATPTASPTSVASPSATPSPTPTAGAVAATPSPTAPLQAAIIGEVGQITGLTEAAQTVRLRQRYNKPVVIAQPLSRAEGQSAVVRISNVQPDQFTVYVQEAPNHDGVHAAETASYIVLEAGAWQLADGRRLAAGQLSLSPPAGELAWPTVSFQTRFAAPPVVFSQVQSENDAGWVKTRQQRVDTSGFALRLEGAEANPGGHGSESVGWLAIEPGQGTWAGRSYEAGTAAGIVTDQLRAFQRVAFETTFDQPPHFIGSISTSNDPDAVALRANVTAEGAFVRLEEDTSQDAETDHAAEDVSYLAIEGAGPLTGQAVE